MMCSSELAYSEPDAVQTADLLQLYCEQADKTCRIDSGLLWIVLSQSC